MLHHFFASHFYTTSTLRYVGLEGESLFHVSFIHDITCCAGGKTHNQLLTFITTFICGTIRRYISSKTFCLIRLLSEFKMLIPVATVFFFRILQILIYKSCMEIAIVYLLVLKVSKCLLKFHKGLPRECHNMRPCRNMWLPEYAV